MKLGLGPVPLKDATRKELERLARHAVAASFDSVWVEESRAEGVGGGLAAAAMLGQAVPIRLGAVVDAALYHPLYLAEDVAIADLTSQGRIEVLLRLATSASSRYEAPTDQGWFEEHLEVLAAALSGAHLQWNGEHLRVPARLDANQPAPERLALNPMPAQPAVPIWIESTAGWMADLARTLGFGVAERWRSGVRVPAASGRWPGMVLCPADVAPGELLIAAGEGAGYFVVAAHTSEEVASVGKRLSGPLRMPGFPDWINS
jgi:alkanesulfonate monooxygenase SsuD/methylene tetrahydromethanopterin reductase-like flavin-dependent oxidoreductase (luciferase family)